MKAEDLMLGDIVTFKDCQRDSAPVIIRIWQINGADEAFAWIGGADALDEIAIDDEIVGIPITLRILRENLPFLYSSVPGGTKEEQARKRVETFEVKFGKIQTTLDYYNESGEVGLTAIRGVRFKYLHELQHAFRILGIDGVCLNKKTAVKEYIGRTGAKFQIDVYQTPKGQILGAPLVWNYAASYSVPNGGGTAGWGEVDGDEEDAVIEGLEKVSKTFFLDAEWYRKAGRTSDEMACRDAGNRAQEEIYKFRELTLF